MRSLLFLQESLPFSTRCCSYSMLDDRNDACRKVKTFYVECLPKWGGSRSWHHFLGLFYLCVKDPHVSSKDHRSVFLVGFCQKVTKQCSLFSLFPWFLHDVCMFHSVSLIIWVFLCFSLVVLIWLSVPVQVIA